MHYEFYIQFFPIDFYLIIYMVIHFFKPTESNPEVESPELEKS